VWWAITLSHRSRKVRMVWGYQTLKDGFFITTYTHVYILILLPHITHSHGLLFYSVFPFTHSLLLSHDMKFSIKNLNMCAYISIILPLPLYKGTYKFIYFDKSHSTNVKSRHQLIYSTVQPTNQTFIPHMCISVCVYMLMHVLNVWCSINLSITWKIST